MVEERTDLAERRPVLPEPAAPGSPNTITDIAEKKHTDQERLERFVCESPWEHEHVEAELRKRVPEAIQGQEAAMTVDSMGIPKTVQEKM